MIWLITAGAVLLFVLGTLHQHRLGQKQIRDTRPAWIAAGERLGLTLSGADHPHLSGTLSGQSIQATVGMLHHDSASVVGTRLSVTVNHCTGSLDPEDIWMLRDAIRSQSSDGLGHGRDRALHHLLLADEAVWEPLLVLSPMGALSLERGTLTLERMQVMSDELEATLVAMGQLAAAISHAILAPLRKRAAGLGLAVVDGVMVGEVSGLPVRIVPEPLSYAVIVTVPGLPSDLSVDQRPSDREALHLGDPILDSVVAVHSPRASDGDRFASSDLHRDFHGDLLTVVCQRGGVVRSGAVKLGAKAADLGDALEDAVRLARALRR